MAAALTTSQRQIKILDNMTSKANTGERDWPNHLRRGEVRKRKPCDHGALAHPPEVLRAAETV